DLERDPVKTTQRVYRFLGVQHDYEPRVMRYNASSRPLSLTVQHGLGRRWQTHPLREANGGGLRERARSWVFKTNLRLGYMRRAPAAPATRKALLSRYRDDILATSRLIGRDL